MNNRIPAPARKLDVKLTLSLFIHEKPMLLTAGTPQCTAASVETLHTGQVNSSCQYAPATVSNKFPQKPATLIRIKRDQWNESCKTKNIHDMKTDPANAAAVPSRDTAPEVPFSTLFNDLIESGAFLLNGPISEAHVSEFAAAIAAANE
jgi:hypothetical protein